MNSCWSPVFWCNNGGTSLSYRPPLRPKLLHICVSFMNSCWSPVFWCNNGGTSLSHPPPPFALNCFIFVSVLWIPVEVPYFDVTMVELRSLTPPPLRPKLLHICVSFMNSCWSPVFWCNNGGTLLSHPPPPPLRPKLLHICVSFMNPCWSPVFWYVTMVELRSLTPPPPFALNCFISVSVLRIPVEVPYFDVTMVELRTLTPPPPSP